MGVEEERGGENEKGEGGGEEWGREDGRRAVGGEEERGGEGWGREDGRRGVGGEEEREEEKEEGRGGMGREGEDEWGGRRKVGERRQGKDSTTHTIGVAHRLQLARIQHCARAVIQDSHNPPLSQRGLQASNLLQQSRGERRERYEKYKGTIQ